MASSRALLFVITIAPLVHSSSHNYLHPSSVVHNHTQRIDHFGYLQRDKTFTQRVIIYDGEWRRNGDPILFYTGNEDDIFMFANYTGFLWEQAGNFSAMVVFAEHRYYGHSMPFGDDGNVSLSSLEKYAYLSVSQAMADFASNIITIKEQYSAPDSPVIVFGGSYGGMLAAYMRHKYPNLITGALASSAPIWTHTDDYNCTSFNEIVTSDFTAYSASCSAAVKASWSAMRRVASTRAGVRWLASTFHLCDGDTSLDVDYFFSWISVIYSILAMTDYPMSNGFLKEKPAYPIGAFCREMPSSLSNVSDRTLIREIYRGLSVSYLNSTGSTQCNSLNSDDGGIAWSVQSCTEIVTPICTSDADMFEATATQGTFNMTEFIEQCDYYYNVTPNWSYMRTELLGRDISSLSNVIFSNGLRDPWSSGGVLATDNPNIDIIIISDGCHHEDLRGSHVNDSSSTVHAREREVTIIRRWIEDHKSGKSVKNETTCVEKPSTVVHSSTTVSPSTPDEWSEEEETQEHHDGDVLMQQEQQQETADRERSTSHDTSQQVHYRHYRHYSFE